MPSPTVSAIEQYYDERVEGKLADFTLSNPRIEAAVRTLAEWAPQSPARVLEIGCGIGATSWRMARAWPGASVVGLDISPGSIAVANACFQLPNLSYRAGRLEPETLESKFDLILLMDVYEHIAPADRAALHSAIKGLLASESRVVVTVPTPAVLDFARAHDPADLQPVDENIDLPLLLTLAHETATDLLYYRQVGIWQYGDYAHVVLGRYQSLAPRPTPPAQRSIEIWNRIRRRAGLREIVSPGQHYLGPDALHPAPPKVIDRFYVSGPERRALAGRWLDRRVEARDSTD